MTTTPRTWVVGEVVAAAMLNTEIRDQWNSVIGAWTSWTPAWTTSSGAATPSYGNATVSCKYLKIGRTVIYKMYIEFGSTTNFGGGGAGDNWLFSLPTASATSVGSVGNAAFQIGGSNATMGPLILQDSTHVYLYTGTGAPSGAAISAGIIDSISPTTWASGDRIVAVGHYEAAS